MDINLLHRLLAQGESSHLDYKSEQYRFAGGSDGDKSELLKDVLAMANAWRETDAFILIGVKEHKGHKAEIVGITEHLDDAAVQQFVNSKTNRPIQFSYTEFEADGKTVGVIHIPLQSRPFFVRKRFASVDADTVYLRRGSSTDIADPDEIHSMGASVVSAKPSLRIEFADLPTRHALGQTLVLKREVLRPLPEEQLPPDPNDGDHILPGGIRIPSLDGGANPDYWRELSEYLFLRRLVGRVGFAVTNDSPTAATGVCVKLTTPNVPEVLFPESLPDRPEYRRPLLPDMSHLRFANRGIQPDVVCTRHGNLWHIEITFGKVQPRATVWTEDELLIGTVATHQVLLAGQVFGDNFEPMHLELRVASEPAVRGMTVEDLRAEDEHGDDAD